MELTGKCKEDFENWLVDNGVFEDWETPDFYHLIESMQYGVYVDFFDSVGTNINVDVQYNFGDECYGNWFEWQVFKVNNFHGKQDFSECATRSEARTEAIKKAVELYNQ